MKRRFTGIAFLLSLLVSVSTTGSASAVSVTPPVASDCSQDVTDAFNSWLATVPDGATIRLARNGCYLTNGTITFTERRNITIAGNGATIKATVDIAPHASRTRLLFDRGGGFVVRDVTLQGTNFSADCARPGGASCYNPDLEHDTGIGVWGSDGVLIDRVHFENIWGDAVEANPGGTWDSQGRGAVPARNVTVRNSTVHTTGRHAFSCVHCRNYTIADNVVSNVGYWMVDVEVEAEAWSGDVTLVRNTYSNVWLGLLGAASDVGVQPGPFVVRDNVQLETDTPVTCWPPIYIAAPTNNLGPATITGNNLRTLGNGITLGRVSNADVERNTTTFVPGGGCGVSAGVALNNVPSGLITHNTFIGANPVATLNSSTATVCGNRTTAKGRYDQPAPC